MESPREELERLKQERDELLAELRNLRIQLSEMSLAYTGKPLVEPHLFNIETNQS
jgi:hypothetical protein